MFGFNFGVFWAVLFALVFWTFWLKAMKYWPRSL